MSRLDLETKKKLNEKYHKRFPELDNISEKTKEDLKKPHLYSFIQKIYTTMCRENRDQVLNMLGEIGSGKTFNLIHIIDY